MLIKLKNRPTNFVPVTLLSKMEEEHNYRRHATFLVHVWVPVEIGKIAVIHRDFVDETEHRLKNFTHHNSISNKGSVLIFEFFIHPPIFYPSPHPNTTLKLNFFLKNQ